MRIAQVAPLSESIPPRFYGGIERVVSYLTEELVHQGHEVTLFASGDSCTSARLEAVCKRALRVDRPNADYFPDHVLTAELVLQQASSFDIIHFHTGFLQFPAARRAPKTTLTTMHGPFDRLRPSPSAEAQQLPVVSITKAQQATMPFLNWRSTIYHGLPKGLYRLHPGHGAYLAFLGRISPEKGPDKAIRIAQASGMKLKIAAKVDGADTEYFRDVIRPLLADRSIEFIDQIDDNGKDSFLGNAYALLHPIEWQEPFGLSLIEAMACGTPTIAYRRGSSAEIVDDGLTGYVVDSFEEAVRAIGKVTALDRIEIRDQFEKRFSSSVMAANYLNTYQSILVDGKTE